MKLSAPLNRYVNMYMYTYVYIYREREREKDRYSAVFMQRDLSYCFHHDSSMILLPLDAQTHIIYIYIYIYIYVI